MMKCSFLSVDERNKLERIMRRSSEAHGVARRANTILLLDDGQNYAQIAAFLYLDDDTIRGWHKHYLSCGWDALKDFSWKGGISRLSHAREQDLCTWLENRFCRDTKEIRHYIANAHFVQYSHAGCIKLLHRLGFVYKKPQKLPRTANEAEQQDFIDFYQDLQRGLPEDEAIYFADAVHPEYQSRPAHGWVRRGAKTALKTTSGRKRVNIHGALCLENFDAPFVEVERVNAHSAIALLEKLEDANPGKKTIHVIWDNASYHKAEAVKAWLRRKNCRIHLIGLPTYAPHLNPIERLWGVMHRYVTHNKFYETQGLFAAAVLEFLRETIPKEWKTFRDTVTDNFRVISHQNFRILE